MDCAAVWRACLAELQTQLPEKQFNLWIRPIQVTIEADCFVLWVPNNFVLDYVTENFIVKIKALLNEQGVAQPINIRVGSSQVNAKEKQAEFKDEVQKNASSAFLERSKIAQSTSEGRWKFTNQLNTAFTFSNFVEGKSNQLARAAAQQVAENAGRAYNPLFIYGGVGLGKTHLMHAVGNALIQKNRQAKVLYLHSERFVADMVKALQQNTINDFKKFYRSLDALLIDDIQFFAGKDRSQEEFFHTFNALLEGNQQVILTCDRYPKELAGLEERLKSRFGWGLTVAIEPPELETRVAILKNKAELFGVPITDEVAFFIAKRIQSNVRELEGALRRVIATAQFTGNIITVEFVKESLKDLLNLQAKLVTIANIQKTVAEYYKIKLADLLSKKRTRILARPRQLAMSLTKELTTHSLPEIADAFGGRDHTTVLHACRTIKQLMNSDETLAADYRNLIRILST